MKDIKYKLLTIDELIISLDRLTRFKLPEESYTRVFNEIIYKCLITPKLNKHELESLDSKTISNYVKLIWNKSIENIFGKEENNSSFNILKFLTETTFKNIDSETKILINTDLHINQLIKHIDYNNAPINLKFLYRNMFNITPEEIIETSIKEKLLFPIRKLIIVEGITEEILLPVFADKLKHNFNENGIYILGAGGKSKSPALYLKLKEKVKIPITLLFDYDAIEICKALEKTVLKKDNIVIIKKGEFEDILSLNLLKRSINKEYEPATPLLKSDLQLHEKMCDNIEDFYRTRHLGEFKKSKLSKIIANNIEYDTDITEEIKDIINIIIKI